MLLRREIKDQNVDRAVVLGETGRDLDRKKEVRPPDQLQAAFDAVVVRQGHERHATGLAELVLPQRICVALGGLEILGEPLTRGQ